MQGTFIANLPPKRHGLTRWLSGSSRSNSLDSPRERASLSLFDDAATAAATDDDALVKVELPDGAWLNAMPRTPVGAPGMVSGGVEGWRQVARAVRGGRRGRVGGVCEGQPARGS